MTYYEKIVSMLPHKLKEPENAINLKKMLKVFSKFLEEDQQKSYKYNMLLSINDLSGSELDVLANMYYVDRLPNESDEDFRIRITQNLIIRKSGTSIQEIQNVINYISGDSNVIIRENHMGKSANVYLTGATATTTYINIFNTIRQLLSAGVRLLVPILMMDTWQDLMNTAENNIWNDISNDIYIW